MKTAKEMQELVRKYQEEKLQKIMFLIEDAAKVGKNSINMLYTEELKELLEENLSPLGYSITSGINNARALKISWRD